MRRVSFSSGACLLGLLISCGEPPPPATPTVPTVAPTGDPQGVPSVSAAPVASAAPSAPAAPRKECPKVTAMAAADEPFWHALAQPGACWTLVPTDGDPARTIVIQTYDARMVGDVDVARLHVTYNGPNGPEDMGERDHWPAQVAATKKGVWFLDRKADDAAVGKALAKAPTHADPVKVMEPSKASKWQWLRKAKTPKGEVVCYGHEIPRAGGACEDTCEGMICVSRTGGFVVAEGTSSPTFGTFRQKGWEIEGRAEKKAAPRKP